MHHSWTKGDFEISTDPARINVSVVYEFLTNSYWAKGIPAETVRRSIENSICFGVYCRKEQVGFARVITDRATFAYLADVFILPSYRGRGLSRWLMECIVGHPNLQGLRRWMLATRDAHGLYARFGFAAVKAPERWMEIPTVQIFTQKPAAGPFQSRKEIFMRSRSAVCGLVQLLALGLGLVVMGCGGSSTPVCKLTTISVSPPTAVANHTAVAPGNMQEFLAFDSTSIPGCVHTLANLTTATWSVSDTTNVSISNVHDATYGVATCKGATTGAATVTATVPVGDGTNVTNTASLTCN